MGGEERIVCGGTLEVRRTLRRTRVVDVHQHQDELLSVAVKFEGETDCYIFTNESYPFGWRHPNLRLAQGRYWVRVTLHYEGDFSRTLFQLQNAGPSCNDLRIKEPRGAIILPSLPP